jgi:aspartate-semialdehyde dehydrogenase
MILFNKKEYPVLAFQDAIAAKPHIVIYSAGSEISLKTARLFSNQGAFVIDNSSAWRMNEEVPLVVPEVNIHTITPQTRIIANPNCSTIQLVVAMHPLHKLFGLKKMVISTYQSVTGTGIAAVNQLMGERVKDKTIHQVYPHPIDLNCFPHGGNFLENGFTTEEMKLVDESKKIMNHHNMQIEATVVRIPVIGGHCESVYAEFDNEFELQEIYNTFTNAQGIIIEDNPNENVYPMPLTAQGKNETFVGRLRHGLHGKNTLHLWIVADNLRKGAATNAIQIAGYIHEKFIGQA